VLGLHEHVWVVHRSSTLLWEEYREAHPDGYDYSRFCDLYREFERRLSLVMRQHHVAGDKVRRLFRQEDRHHRSGDRRGAC
jgi:transposase